MKRVVHVARAILYFPVSVGKFLGLPLRVQLRITSLVVRLDKPLRSYLLGGKYAL